MKKSITMKAMGGKTVAMAILDEAAKMAEMDAVIDRILANGMTGGDELTVLEYIAICEAEMAKAAS